VNVWTIAVNTFGEAMRKRALNVFLLVAIILIILSNAFAFFTTPQQGNRVELTIVRGMGLAVIMLSGLVMSIFLGMDLVPTEIERRTIYTILSKPVRRYHYIAGKLLGASLTLLINLGLMGLFFLAVVAYKTRALEPQLLVGVLLFYIQFVLLGSVAVFFSVVLTKNINVALTFFVFVVGTLSEYWQSVANLAGHNQQKIVEVLAKAVHLLVPNFGNFNIANPLIHPEALQEIPRFGLYVAKTVGYGLLYTAIMLVLACIAFERKEV
jgi:ABC-type transport system involved in multi-copper enzyme maturation permease subunit